MKIEKKHIIIAIVVVVALWLLWKRGVFAKTSLTGGNDGTGGGSSAANKASLDYIMTHIAFTAEERAKINAMYDRAMTDKSYYQSIMAKANANGHSFDQQLVLDAIWGLYHPNLDWIAGPDGSTDYGWKLQYRVLDL